MRWWLRKCSGLANMTCVLGMYVQLHGNFIMCQFSRTPPLNCIVRTNKEAEHMQRCRWAWVSRLTCESARHKPHVAHEPDTYCKYTHSPPGSDGGCNVRRLEDVGTLSRTGRQSSSAAMSCSHPVKNSRTRLCCDEAGLKVRQALLEPQSMGTQASVCRRHWCVVRANSRFLSAISAQIELWRSSDRIRR